MGWSGVDLFFVLSGFLVGGLLYTEYQRCGTVSTRRFLLRRAFKIYPPFYVLLIVTFLAQIGGWRAFQRQQWLGECFFMQNYVGRVWSHTWSLAVEEHFYLLIAIAFWIASRTSLLERPRCVFSFGMVILVSILIYRIWISATASNGNVGPMLGTHMRIDSLVFGAMLAYAWHFFRDRVNSYIRSERWVLLVLAAGCLAPLTCMSYEGPWLHGSCFTFNYLGYGSVLMLGIGDAWRIESRILRLVANLLGAIGRQSYSIYLWHLAVFAAVNHFVPRTMHHETRFFTHAAIYITLSILLGSLTGRLIESPVLKLRDRIIPARNSSHAATVSYAATEAPRFHGLHT